MRNRNTLVTALSVLLIAGSLVYLAKQISLSASYPLGQAHTITVMGEGEARMAPDTMQVLLTVSETASSSQAAQNAVDTKMEQVREILNSLEIPTSNITTQDLSVYPEYEYTELRGRIENGFRASQTLSVQIGDDDYQSKSETLIRQITSIDGVQVSNTSFILEDQESVMLDARADAFADAKQKAEQLANLADMKLGKTVMISDNSSSYSPGPIPYYARTMVSDSVESMPSTELNPGETTIQVQIQVVFELH